MSTRATKSSDPVENFNRSGIGALSRVNLNHLLYFWVVAREGSITAASRALDLTHPTVSSQVHALERALGRKLLSRRGRSVVLTEEGRLARDYANSIMALGGELVDLLATEPMERPRRLQVGIANAIPKLVVRALLEPALRLPDPVRLVCREDRPARLFAALGANELDVVLTDVPLAAHATVRGFNHVLGESDVSFFAPVHLARKLESRFPRSLDGAPVILPTDDSNLRTSLDAWLLAEDLRPRVVAEVEDAALLTVFGRHGLGAFAAPTVVASALHAQYGVVPIGRVRTLRETFYAVSAERRLHNPAVVAIREAARASLFARV